MAKKYQNSSRFGRIIKALLLAALFMALLIGTVQFLGRLRNGQPEADSDPAPVAQSPVPESTLDLEAFTAQDGRVAYPGATLGIDVSSHQGQIDWQAVAADGISFAILRIGYRGYTVGEINLDETFQTNFDGARAAGIQTGVYFFSQAVTEEEAVEEAQFVLEMLGGAALDCPVYFDWEEILDEHARTAQMDPATLNACALAFCQTITEAGYDAGIYFNLDYGYRQYNLAELEPYEFWLAEYADTPSFQFDVELWQYTDAGTVAGISERVDLNLRFPK